MEIQSVKQQINEAFSALTIPDADAIVTFPLNTWEKADIRYLFGGKAWQDIPYQVLSDNSDSLSFFSPVGFYFYLPAFMCAAMDAPRDSFLLTTVLFHLMPEMWSNAGPGGSRKIFEGFSSLENAAVRSFLEFVAELNPDDSAGTDARIALREFWGKERSQR